MKMGQEGDKRSFTRPYLYEVTKDVSDREARWLKCAVCGLEVKGKAFRLNEKEVVCFRCHNE